MPFRFLITQIQRARPANQGFVIGFCKLGNIAKERCDLFWSDLDHMDFKHELNQIITIAKLGDIVFSALLGNLFQYGGQFGIHKCRQGLLQFFTDP